MASSGQAEAQPGCQPGRQVAAVGGGGEQDCVGRLTLHGSRQGVTHSAAAYRPQRGIVQHQHPVGPGGSQGGRVGVAPSSYDHRHNLAAGYGGQVAGLAQHFVGNVGQTVPRVLGNHPDAAFRGSGVTWQGLLGRLRFRGAEFGKPLTHRVGYLPGRVLRRYFLKSDTEAVGLHQTDFVDPSGRSLRPELRGIVG